jgi:UDP-2,3-diacylglucosamine hydrolase
LHLQANRPDITAALIEFLAENRGRTSELYILGDLFELWVGDDLDSALAEAIAAHLQAFNAAGSQVYLMHGNRDFLLGSAYADRCGAHLIHEPYSINSSQGPITLLHGDVLCTDDVEYQQFRTLVRSRAWQTEFLSKPLEQRLAFAEQARSQSRESTAAKSAAIMDVNDNAVLDFMSANAAVTILHGHTHRPAVHKLISPDSPATWQRIVLGDWDSQGWYVEVSELGLDLKSFNI